MKLANVSTAESREKTMNLLADFDSVQEALQLIKNKVECIKAKIVLENSCDIYNAPVIPISIGDAEVILNKEHARLVSEIEKL